MKHLLSICLVACLATQSAIAQERDDSQRQIQALEWRCVGPHMGVRGCGVAMHPTDRNIFYHAHSSGGVWKTEDAGQYWIQDRA